MKRLFTLNIIILTFITCGGIADKASLNESIVAGQFNIKEISAATMLPGDRLLLASDEKDILLLDGAAKHLKDNKFKDNLFKPIKPQVVLDDVEDVALTTNSEVYFITSHSRNRSNQSKPERNRIGVLQFEADGKPKELIATEPGKLKTSLTPELQNAMARTPAQSGFNIEGAAWNNDGHLLLGLRSPTQTSDEKRNNKLNEDAIVLRVKNPKALFSSENLQIEEIKLNLDAKGIRAMHYDLEQKGVWIVTGLSPDPNYDVQNNWALWFWDEKNPPKKSNVPDTVFEKINYPEAVCRVTIDNTPYLLLIEDSENSRYVAFPLSNL